MIRLAFYFFLFPAGGWGVVLAMCVCGGGRRLVVLGLSLIFSPFVYCFGGGGGGGRGEEAFASFPSFSGPLLRREDREGDRVAFCSSESPGSPPQPHPSHLARRKTPGLVPTSSLFVLFIIAAFLPGSSNLLVICIPFTSPF